METPNEKELRKMPYSSLKRYAKNHGVKGNIKTEKLISTLLSLTKNEPSDDDSFLLIEAQIMNSSSKNKHARFDEDQKQLNSPFTPKRDTYTVASPYIEFADQVPTVTPRRETFSMDSPSLLQVAPNLDIVDRKMESPSIASDSTESKVLRSSKVSVRKSRKSGRKSISSSIKRQSLRLKSGSPHVDIASVVSKTATTESPAKSINEKKLSISEVSAKKHVLDGKNNAATPVQLTSTSPNVELLLLKPADAGSEIPSTVTDVMSEENKENPPRKSGKVNKPKVSFITPRSSPRLNANNSGSPFTSVRNRPKTPLALRNSLRKGVKFQTPKRTTPYKKTSDFIRSRRSTPYRLETTPKNVESNDDEKQDSTTPMPTPRAKKQSSSVKITPLFTPKFTLGPKSKPKYELSSLKKTAGSSKRFVLTPSPSVVKSRTKMTVAAPSSSKRFVLTPSPSVVKSRTKMTVAAPNSSTRFTVTPSPVVKSHTKKAGATPNFQVIHKKAFAKMESIDEYHKRKLVYSAKKKTLKSSPSPKSAKKPDGVIKKKAVSKIPTPFIPTVTKTKHIVLNFASKSANFTPVAKNTRLHKNNNSVAVKVFTGGVNQTPAKKELEEKPISKKPKFNLQASLARKLNYKPYKGALKPLSDSRFNADSSESNLCYHKKVNQVVEKQRMKSRDVLQGVRKNKRFDLQMSRRGM